MNKCTLNLYKNNYTIKAELVNNKNKNFLQKPLDCYIISKTKIGGVNMINEIIPTPKKINLFDGVQTVSFNIISQHSDWNGLLKTFAHCFKKICSMPLNIKEGGITLIYDASLQKDSYRIDTTNGVNLYASSDKGICYAFASLLQMFFRKADLGILLLEDGLLQVEKAVIEDWADKDYRALLVDVARHWHPFKALLNYVDICFLLKIKYLHIHFIDDVLYTLPSKAFPEITKSNKAYTFEEIEKLNSYANEKCITIIPEFEASGHAAVMNKNYPEIFANKIECDGFTIQSELGATITAENIICAGKQECFEACKTLLEEIAEMFPNSPYIHIGGDEANINAWNDCVDCKEYMRANNIANVKELYSDFVGRIAQAVIDMGRTPMVWEGFPKEGVEKIPKETVVIAWESYYHLAPDLLNAGFKIINCAWKPLYIVPSPSKRWDYTHVLDWNVYRWTHWWNASPAFYDPIKVKPTDNVLGGSLAAWECTYEQSISRIMENLPALAEKTWNVSSKETPATFSPKLLRAVRLLSLFIAEE